MSGAAGRPRTVGQLGEFELIERLAARLPPAAADVVAGIGDDVAAVRAGPGDLLLATCDAQVEDTHFVAARCDPQRLGRKVAAVNLSDIAAAGGRPTHMLVSLILPPSVEIAFVEALYDGLGQEAARWGAGVVGGNVSRGAVLVVDVTLLGRVAPGALLRRSGARAGDRLLVTGALGAAAAGRWLAERPQAAVGPAARRGAADAFELPVPRLREAARLTPRAGARAAIDVSDGFAADLAHLCAASGVGARIDARRLPVAPEAREIAAAAGVPLLDWVLGGGEDYELLVAVAPERAAALAAAVTAATGTPVADVGEATAAGRGRLLVLDGGAERALDAAGWRHF